MQNNVKHLHFAEIFKKYSEIFRINQKNIQQSTQQFQILCKIFKNIVKGEA